MAETIVHRKRSAHAAGKENGVKSGRGTLRQQPVRLQPEIVSSLNLKAMQTGNRHLHTEPAQDIADRNEFRLFDTVGKNNCNLLHKTPLTIYHFQDRLIIARI